MATLNDFGHEQLDPMPKSLTIPFRRPEPLHLKIRRMILEASREQYESHESFEDADDFEVGEPADYEDRTTPYEEHFDHIPALAPKIEQAPAQAEPDGATDKQ